jgi:hypothetical protein
MQQILVVVAGHSADPSANLISQPVLREGRPQTRDRLSVWGAGQMDGLTARIDHVQFGRVAVVYSAADGVSLDSAAYLANRRKIKDVQSAELIQLFRERRFDPEADTLVVVATEVEANQLAEWIVRQELGLQPRRLAHMTEASACLIDLVRQTVQFL